MWQLFISTTALGVLFLIIKSLLNKSYIQAFFHAIFVLPLITSHLLESLSGRSPPDSFYKSLSTGFSQLAEKVGLGALFGIFFAIAVAAFAGTYIYHRSRNS